MAQYKGASRQHEVAASRRRKDTRLLGRKISDFIHSGDGIILALLLLPIAALALIKIPLSGELLLFVVWIFGRTTRADKRSFDFPYRVPFAAKVRDGSTKQGKGLGDGVTLIGTDLETKEQIYAGPTDLRAHLLALGTTGSGKTEFLLGLAFNALVQNTGLIYCDGKGDPKLQKEMFRLLRYVGRECDLLLINFITSGRDFFEKQTDKVTNNMNIMGNTSSGMLIEWIISLMDDSGGGGDMWKGRAISFVAALTRPLTYLRDKGFINLSPEKYLEYFEITVLEELVFEHNNKYGEAFEVIVAPLRSYLVTLPGYQLLKRKKQETKTLEQHGFIVMQLTRVFNDLTFNYGHIFKTKVGDVDFFDVVFNRRVLVVLLPALERAPDSMRMLGKMIVGSIKQMMAGCLGNKVEGVVREIIDSRPTNAKFPFYVILDEYGYYSVVGFAVAPAQARGLGFSITFAAQDFSSLKKSSAEEADATWENTNIRAIGRITSGQRSETWERIQGASGEADETRLTGFERTVGGLSEKFKQQDNVSIESRARLNYDDLAMQENGEFTFLVGKKERNGTTGGVRVIRGMSFYTAGVTPKEMRLNDFLPVEAPEPSELPKTRDAREALMRDCIDGSFPKAVRSAIKGDPVVMGLSTLFDRNHDGLKKPRVDRSAATFGALGWYIAGMSTIPPAIKKGSESNSSSSTDAVDRLDLVPTPPNAGHQNANDPLGLKKIAAEKALLDFATSLFNKDKNAGVTYLSQTSAGFANDADEISISAKSVTTNILMTDADADAFRAKAMPILRRHLFMIDGMPAEDEWEDELKIADRQKLLEMEILATGEAFASLGEKWATEDEIEETQKTISSATSYMDPPEPYPIDINAATGKLNDLTATCDELMRQNLRGS
jgi:intracellular multiplication protein IcmO